MLSVSIITVCFNSAETIENTIQSVIEQDYSNIQYIVVDGKSKDDTLKILERYKEHISILLSEKDDGIYYAINKGIALATGDIIAILHADDFYCSNQVISSVVKTFQEKQTDTVYGDLQYVHRNDTNKVTRHWIAGAFNSELFRKGWMPPHPAFFVQRSCYSKFGVFNTDLKSSADYEMMLRLLEKHKCSTQYIPQVLVKMRVGGKSNVSLTNRIKANREDKKAWLINGLKPGTFTLILKPLSKLGQFF